MKQAETYLIREFAKLAGHQRVVEQSDHLSFNFIGKTRPVKALYLSFSSFTMRRG